MIRPLLNLLSPAGPDARLSILIFHRVLAQPDPLFPWEMHAARFDAMLGWLTHWFHILPLREAAECLRSGSLPARALAISFDDGYADNHAVALPILQKHEVHASFFIASDFLDGHWMWNDRLTEAVRLCPQAMLDAGAFGCHALDSPETRRQTINTLIARIKYLPVLQRDAAVEEIVRRAGGALPDCLMMRPDQIRALHQAGMEIGAHTASHPILAGLSATEAVADMVRGRTALEDIVGEPVTGFAYPNGIPGQDYRQEHVAMVRTQGFDYAVSTAHGAARFGDDMFQLPRFTPWDNTRSRFGLRMVGNLANPRGQSQRRASTDPLTVLPV